jgi:hypothetical protein
VESPSQSGASGVKSFSITDILSHKPVAGSKSVSKETGRNPEGNNVVIQQRIVRPWDPQSKSNGRRNSSDSSPLDALFQMTSKTFEGLNGHHESAGKQFFSKLLPIFTSSLFIQRSIEGIRKLSF